MNVYRGCSHGCIYCDARSKCYQFDHAFEDIEVKQNEIREQLNKSEAICYDADRYDVWEVIYMMYPFMTLDDDTEITHSQELEDGRVKVYIEKPDDKDCFHHATCFLPNYDWEDISGFTPEEIDRYREIIESTAHLIIRFAREGGFDNASGF
jgi:hypothetical protein